MSFLIVTLVIYVCWQVLLEVDWHQRIGAAARSKIQRAGDQLRPGPTPPSASGVGKSVDR